MDIRRIDYDPEQRSFKYWIAFKPDAVEEEVRSHVSVEAAFSVSETGELADISFMVPKACRSEHAMSFLHKQENARYIEPRMFIVVPGQNGDSALRAPADLQLDQHGRIVALAIH